jgi:integrase
MRAKVSKYYNMFPEDQKRGNGRFLRKLQNGKVSANVLGENTIAKIGTDMALWLGYSPEVAKNYTSHCFRRTAATLLAEKGVSHDALKIAGGWKSDRACKVTSTTASK